jgi:Glutamyl- and glutaminyl-tRNA synthetases
LNELSTQLETWDMKPEIIKQKIHDFAESKSLGMGKVMMPLRLSLVGELKGPDVPDILEILGKEESVARIKNAVHQIK